MISRSTVRRSDVRRPSKNPAGLEVAVPAVEIERVARRDVALVLRGHRQLACLSAPADRAVRDGIAGIVGEAAVVLGQFRVIAARVPRRKRQVVRRGPADVRLEAADARLVRVLDLGEAVLAEDRELEVLPVLLKDRAVPEQVVIEPLGLPAELVVVEIVGLVRRQRRAPVDAARTEALRPCRVDHLVRVELVREVRLAEEVVFARALVEVAARCAVERIRIEAGRFALRSAVPRRKAVEALEAVVGPEVAAAERAGQLLGEVEVHLAEHGLVVVLAHLLRQPERVRMAGDRKIGAEAVDQVLLVDVVASGARRRRRARSGSDPLAATRCEARC